jgi:phenylacetate-CoA ligase
MNSYDQYFNNEIELMANDELWRLQNEKFMNQLKYTVENSKFYQEKLRNDGVELQSIQSIDDIRILPFTEKEELRLALLDQPPILGSNQTAKTEDIIRIHSSSGTTGRPSYVGITKKDAALWEEGIARSFWAAGIRPNDIVAHCFNYSMFVGGLANHIGGERLGATMIPIGVGQSKKLITIIQDLGVTAITATPSYVLYLANVVQKEFGLKPSELGIKKIITGGEPGGGIPKTRELIEHIWNAKCFEVMGSVDLHPIMGSECEHQSGMHFLVEDMIFPELIDLKSNQPIPIEEGAKGELILSHLERYVNPILRFKSHDIVEIQGTECQCGRSGFRYKIIGRTDDMLIVKGVNVYPSAFEDVLRNIKELTGEFAILVHKEGVQQEFIDLVVEQKDALNQSRSEALKELIQRKISENLLVKATVTILEPNSLPKSEHKAKRVFKKYLGEYLTIK